MEKLTNFIKNNRPLYCISRTIKSLRDPNLYSLLQGYYENSDLFQSFLVRHNESQVFENLIYNISYGVNTETHTGLFGMLRGILEYLSVSERLNLTPVIFIGEKSLYFDHGMDDKTTNVFEYYFQPVSDVPYAELQGCRNIIDCRVSHRHLGLDDPTCFEDSLYHVSEETITRWARIYKKYIKLNDTVHTYVKTESDNILCGKKTIGVHYRGTDFNLGYKNHPRIGSLTNYIDKAKKIIALKGYDRVFLATDDTNVLKRFQNEFGDKLVYYSDTFRASGTNGLHTIKDTRDLHKYKLGLEVVRDVYTLAQCNGFVSGPSYVSFAARYIKRSMNSEYSDMEIINNGFYSHESKQVRKLDKMISHDIRKNP